VLGHGKEKAAFVPLFLCALAAAAQWLRG